MPFDPATWSELLAPHLEDPDSRVAGRARAEWFSAELLAARVLVAYREVLGRARSRDGGRRARRSFVECPRMAKRRFGIFRRDDDEQGGSSEGQEEAQAAESAEGEADPTSGSIPPPSADAARGGRRRRAVDGRFSTTRAEVAPAELGPARARRAGPSRSPRRSDAAPERRGARTPTQRRRVRARRAPSRMTPRRRLSPRRRPRARRSSPRSRRRRDRPR